MPFSAGPKYAHAKRADYGSSSDARKFRNKHINELIATALPYYDYEIENTAHFREKDECSEEEVFEPLKKVKLTAQNARVLAMVEKNARERFLS